MKTLLAIFLVSALASCGGKDNAAAPANSSNLVTNSAALQNVDTTSVLGASHIGQGHMRTDAPMSGSNVGK